MSWSTSELRVRLAPLNRFKPSSKIFYWPFQGSLLLWIFYVFVLSCVCYVLCASVYMCFVVTCWERADLLALVCGVFCEFVTFPLVSWVRCGTWLYRFLIFATLLLCGHLLGKGWPLGSRLWCLLWVCHLLIGILGQVWYLIVSIPDLCTLTYFGLRRIIAFGVVLYRNHWPVYFILHSAALCIGSTIRYKHTLVSQM